jgi:prolyl oligopeptidase
MMKRYWTKGFIKSFIKKGYLGFATLAGVLAAVAVSWVPASIADGTHADAAVTAPPVAPVRMVTDEYFGVNVPDPYRYFEDLANPEVAAWFKGQNEYTRSVLSEIPGRTALLARIKELDSGEPAVVNNVRRLPNDRFFYEKRLASEDVFTLYVRDGLNGTERVLIDPAKFATPGGPHYVISYYSPSLDGHFVVAGISAAGSEDAVLRVFDTSTGHETGDVIDRAQFGGGSWLPDSRSFLYNRLQKTDANSAPTDRYLNSKTYLHVMGTNPEQDKLVFGAGVPGIKIEAADIPFVTTSPGAKYAVGIIAHGVRNEVTGYVAPIDSLGDAAIPWKQFCDVDDDVTGLDVHGEDLYLISHHQASRFKVLRTALANADVAHAAVLVPPSEAVVQNIAAASDALYVQELNGGPGKLVRVPYSGGKPEEVALPFEGAVGLSATDQRLPGTLVELTSWTRPNKIYAYDPANKSISDTKLQPAGKFDGADLESKEVKVKSYDGTLVPLSIVYKKGLKLDGTNPTLLQGYGSYGITEDPYFDPRRIAWYERGGVLAVAHIRGGGEYGEDWHLAGKLLTKPNTWKDFIACAEYLVQQKYTATPRLAIWGGSAGGITIGRSITERPDLFAVAIDAVPMSDVVRAEFTPNGPPNIPEFGTVKEADGFKALYEMSGYHHIKDGTAYPAVMLTTGYNDPRVISWQPGKMAARLQAATSSKKPILLRVDYDAGHGIGSTKSQREEELADEMSFQLWQFGVAGFQVAK